MSDELDLPFDEREEERGDKGRHRGSYVRRRKKGARGGGGRGKTIFALLMVMVLLGGLGGGAWYGFDRIQGYFITPDYDGPGKGEALVEVKAGEFASDIATTLYKADVVKSAKAFIEAANANPKSKGLQVGKYKLRKQMRAADALTLMLDPKSRVVSGLTIPEGMISLEIYEKLSKETKIPVADFKKAAADPIKLGVPASWFKRTDKRPPLKTPSIEGFLYPSTYEVPEKATAEQILKMMVQEFLRVTGEMNFTERVRNERKISPYEALVAASIAQAESVHQEDMAKVTRVLYNRVYGDGYHCHCLEIDSAVNYNLKITGKDAKDSDDLSHKEIHDPKNPYNTHEVDGLPPGPISNPGKTALEGAMNPPAGKWLYFMTIDKEGTMGYGTTDADYNKLIATMCKNGVLSGENC